MILQFWIVIEDAGHRRTHSSIKKGQCIQITTQAINVEENRDICQKTSVCAYRILTDVSWQNITAPSL